MIAVQLGLPAGYALHIKLEEQAQIRWAQLAAELSLRQQKHQAHSSSVPQRPPGHDESQCAVCQAYFSVRSCSLSDLPQIDLSLERSPWVFVVTPTSIHSQSLLSDPTARGPPQFPFAA
jgi:hypothetical protein